MSLVQPPSVSLAIRVRSIGEKARSLWRRVRAALPSNNVASIDSEGEKEFEKRMCTEIKK